MVYNPSTSYTAVVQTPLRNPFETYAAVTPPRIEAAQLGHSNFADIAYFMVTQGQGAIAIDSDRASITFGGVRFEIGEWIVSYSYTEPDSTVHYKGFRHVTEQEAQDFGLTEFTL